MEKGIKIARAQRTALHEKKKIIKMKASFLCQAKLTSRPTKNNPPADCHELAKSRLSFDSHLCGLHKTARQDLLCASPSARPENCWSVGSPAVEGGGGKCRAKGARCSPVGQGMHGWHEDGLGHRGVGLQRSTQCRRTAQKVT